MKPSHYLTLILSFIVTFSSAQQTADTVKYWKKKLNFGININQASFSSNWTGGGVNSIGFNSVFTYRANYAKDRHSWDNEIGLLFGFVNNKGQGYRKTVDRIFLDTKYGYALNKKWDLFTSLNFLSQFAQGFKYENDVNGIEQEFLISDFLAPAFITSAWGVEYHPTDYFKVRLSPFAPRVTIVKDNNGRFATVDPLAPYGVKVGESTRFEWLAFQLFAEFNKDIAPSLNLAWRYIMFANYETLDVDKIDHRLELLLTAKVNKFINVSLGGIMVYDYDQIDEVQFSQLFTLGFAYTFQNYKEETK